MKNIKTAELYNKRFENFGNNLKTVGWGNKKDQLLRFEVLFRNLNPIGKTILDVGCGLGHLVDFLVDKTDNNFQYTGIDIAENLVDEARKNYESKNIKFINGDVFSIEDKFDIVVVSGAFSHKTYNIIDYTYKSIKKMYNISSESVCINFLSKYVDYELEKNQHYYPQELYSEIKKYCDKIVIIDDYPLYEFTLQLKKKYYGNKK